MNRFYRYGPPFNYYNPYQRRPLYNNYPNTMSSVTNIPDSEIKSEKTNVKETHSRSSEKNPVWFDLFGLKLYFDDVLILSLLFFLYKEEVKDEGLFLALVLLLIT